MVFALTLPGFARIRPYFSATFVDHGATDRDEIPEVNVRQRDAPAGVMFVVLMTG